MYTYSGTSSLKPMIMVPVFTRSPLPFHLAKRRSVSAWISAATSCSVTFVTPHTSCLTPAVGSCVSKALTFHTYDWLRDIRLNLISQTADVHILRNIFIETDDHGPCFHQIFTAIPSSQATERLCLDLSSYLMLCQFYWNSKKWCHAITGYLASHTWLTPWLWDRHSYRTNQFVSVTALSAWLSNMWRVHNH